MSTYPMSAPSPMTAKGAPRTRNEAPRTRLRITRRGRLVVSAIVALPLVAAAWFGVLDGGSAIASHEQSGVEFEYLTVQPGQTLWQLAEDLAPTADPRDVVAEIMQLNNLAGAELVVGDRLAIPFEYTE